MVKRLTPRVLDHYLHHDLVVLQLLWCFCSVTHLWIPRSPPKFIQLVIVLPRTPPPPLLKFHPNLFVTCWVMLSTNKQINKQTNQRYQKHNLLCQGGNKCFILLLLLLWVKTLWYMRRFFKYGFVSFYSNSYSFFRKANCVNMWKSKKSNEDKSDTPRILSLSIISRLLIYISYYLVILIYSLLCNTKTTPFLCGGGRIRFLCCCIWLTIILSCGFIDVSCISILF